MADLFISILKIAKNYTGSRILFAFTALLFGFLLIREKKPDKKLMLGIVPLVCGLIFLCPLTLFIYEKTGLDPDTYYRMLWIIPFGVITVYGFMLLFEKNLFISFIAGAAIIMITGSFVYSSPVLYKSPNIYGIPQETIDIVEYLRSIDDHQRITVLPSSVTCVYFRQYDPDILMPYGRDMFNASLNYCHPVFEAYEKPEVINMEELVSATRDFDVEYILIYAGKRTDRDPEEVGLIYLNTVDDYAIYRDPVITEKIKEIERYYEDEL